MSLKGNNKENDYFKLNSLCCDDRLSEVSFDYDSGVKGKFKNLLTGAIDLVFRRGEVYSILDWKSDTLNDKFTSYSDPEQLKNRVDSHYSIQRVIYSYSLIKWLTQYYKLKNVEKNLTESDIFKNHFGGIYYIFVRGCNEGTSNGIYCQTWESWEDLEKEFIKIKMECIGGK